MTHIPRKIEEKIHKRVYSDLDPHLWVVYLKMVFAVGVGGGLSMLVCGQFGMGLTSFADVVSHSIHGSWHHLACASFCGTVFAVVPTIVLRLTCSPLQYRGIVGKQPYLPSLMLLVSVFVFFLLGDTEGDVAYLLVWLVSAVATFHLCAKVVDSFGADNSRLNFYQNMSF